VVGLIGYSAYSTVQTVRSKTTSAETPDVAAEATGPSSNS
jgi:hypothetical protein